MQSSQNWKLVSSLRVSWQKQKARTEPPMNGRRIASQTGKRPQKWQMDSLPGRQRSWKILQKKGKKRSPMI